MSPSFAAFADEILRIKEAEADEPQVAPMVAEASPVQDEEKPFRSDLPITLKERLKSGLKYGLGYGLGTAAGAAGYALGQKYLSRLMPQPWSEAAKLNVGRVAGVLGTASSLLALEAMRQSYKAEQDALQRHH
jgi:hypothetical protein